MKKITLILTFLCAFTSCVSFSRFPEYKSPYIPDLQFYHELDLEKNEQGYLIITLSNGIKSGYFLIDTGAENTVIFEETFFKRIERKRSVNIYLSFFKKTIESERILIDDWELFPDISLKNFEVLVTDQLPVAVEGSELKMIGILGMDFISSFQVFFKNSESKVLFSRGQEFRTRKIPSFQAGKSWVRIPLNFLEWESKGLYRNVYVDTGAPGGYYAGKNDHLYVNPLGSGQNKLAVQVFPFDDFSFTREISVKQSTLTDGVVGNELLSSFDWGLDLKEGVFLLEPMN